MRFILICTTFALFAGSAFAHDGDHDSYADRSKASTTTKGDKRIIESNGLPDHKPGDFPNHGNPNSISEQHYRFEMPLKPKAGNEPMPLRRYLFGVAINGVVFDPGTAEVWTPGDKIVSRPRPRHAHGAGHGPQPSMELRRPGPHESGHR